MNDEKPRLLLLESGIFPDTKTVQQAVELIDGYRVQREQLNVAAMSSGDWDRVLAEIVQSEKVVTL